MSERTDLYQRWSAERDAAEAAYEAKRGRHGRAYVFREGCLLLSEHDDLKAVVAGLRDVSGAVEHPDKSLVADMINEVNTLRG